MRGNTNLGLEHHVEGAGRRHCKEGRGQVVGGDSGRLGYCGGSSTAGSNLARLLGGGRGEASAESPHPTFGVIVP